jgi:hypothetical protein
MESDAHCGTYSGSERRQECLPKPSKIASTYRAHVAATLYSARVGVNRGRLYRP